MANSFYSGLSATEFWFHTMVRGGLPARMPGPGHALSLTHCHSPSLILSHSITAGRYAWSSPLTLTLHPRSHTHYSSSHSLTHSHSLPLTITHSFSLTLAHSLPLTITHSVTLSHSHSLPLTHSHSHCRPLPPSLSLPPPCQGGREGLVDTAVKTAETGYMSRRLMKVCVGGWWGGGATRGA